MNNKISEMRSIINNDNITPAASFDGSDIVKDINYFFRADKKPKNERAIKNIKRSLKIVGTSEDELKNYKNLDEFIQKNKENIFIALLKGLKNEQNKKLISAGFVLWAYSCNKLELIDVDITNLIPNEGVKNNASKFKGLVETLGIIFGETTTTDSITVLEDIKKSRKYKNLPQKELYAKNEIIRLRSIFRKRLKEQSLSLIDEYKSWNNGFELPEAAHIVSVKQCIDNNRTQDIINPNNGIVLDPNTHTLLDAGRIKSFEDLKIDNKFLNDERNEFIKKAGL